MEHGPAGGRFRNFNVANAARTGIACAGPRRSTFAVTTVVGTRLSPSSAIYAPNFVLISPDDAWLERACAVSAGESSIPASHYNFRLAEARADGVNLSRPDSGVAMA